MKIETQKEFNNLCDEKGNFCVDENVEFDCNISTEGNISARDIIARYISALDISARDIIARDIIARYISAQNISALDISARYISASKLTCTNFYWDQIYIPRCKILQIKGFIYPTMLSREYWEERLGIKLEGCYSEIQKIVKPHLTDWLKSDKWTPTERWILTNWHERIQEMPDEK